MNSIDIFNTEEEKIIGIISSLLKDPSRSDDSRQMNNNISAIVKIAEAISLYPSLLDRKSLDREPRNIETLVENICEHKGLDLLLNTPIKALLGRQFAIAKMNFFLYLSYLCSDLETIFCTDTDIRRIVYNYVFSIMTEDVFIAIISDRSIEHGVRREAALHLAHIWETRVYKGVQELAPMLIDLWRSRLVFKPSYGTMTGISEITKFSTSSNPMMIDFIAWSEFNEDVLEALREYLMGLSYREIMKVQEYMHSNSMTSITRHDIRTILGEKRSYPLRDPDDPREMYHFFSRRNDNAQYRSRSGISGPKKTIEEYMVYYLIDNKMFDDNSAVLTAGQGGQPG